jgi:hypothetical protein
MTYIAYEIIRHDGGWAYKLGDTVSGTFASQQDAIEGARSAAARQKMAQGDIVVREQISENAGKYLVHS